ncbi:MAG: SRPBCC domain-containing protein [Anaerolineae bacterium]
MSDTPLTTTSYGNGCLTVTRQFDAPRPAVFDAWIKTSKVELWWGCDYATKVKSEIEPKVGGKYSHLMTLRDVGEYHHCGLITAYDPPALLMYELADPFRNETMTVRVEFSENESGTLVKLIQDNTADEHSEFVIEGWTAGFEKLATLFKNELALTYADQEAT